jgi:hypothetical protein
MVLILHVQVRLQPNLESSYLVWVGFPWVDRGQDMLMGWVGFKKVGSDAD